MATEVILLDNIDTLGNCGDKVRVADGYARNFLFPRKLAVLASKAAIKQIEARKQKVAAEEAAKKADAEVLAQRISEVSLTITMQAGEDDKLFGSVTVADLHALLAKEGVDVERRAIHIGDAIRKLGVHEVSIRCHREVTAVLKVWVVKA